MNPLQDKDFSNFKTLLDLWAGAYQCAVISYVGLKTPKGPRLLFGRVLLEPARDGVNDMVFQFETDHVLAARFITNATQSDIDVFLIEAENGEIRNVNNLANVPLQCEENLSTYFASIYHPAVSEGPRVPSLLIRGDSRHNLYAEVADSRQLDWELKAAEIPFDTLDELLNHCALPTLMQMGDSTTLEIIAKSPAMVSSASTIKENKAVIECHLTAALEPEKLRLGFKVFQQDSIDRGSINGSKFKWRKKSGINVGTWRKPVGDAHLIQTFLSYAGASLHQWWVADPLKRLNPRQAIHQTFDADMSYLRQMLFEPKNDQDYVFESAVTTLLGLLGFSVTNYGRAPKLQDGPDIIALAPAGNVAVVECTIGLLDNKDKLAKLVQRSTGIREKLNQAGHGFLQVQAVIVSSLSRGDVAANMETASKHDIAVVCREDIEQLLNQVGLPPNADKLFEDTKGLIPSFGQESLFT